MSTIFCKTIIPGLLIANTGLSRTAQNLLLSSSIKLNSKMKELSTYDNKHRSLNHNLKRRKDYSFLYFDEGGKRINAQFFDDYSCGGHDLTYFMGNQNIPTFVRDSLVRMLEKKEGINNSGVDWKLTFNVYSSDTYDGEKGFEWHKDIPENGNITYITSLGNRASLYMRKGVGIDQSMFNLEPGSIVKLSGEARWDYEHCVINEVLPSIF